MCWWSQLKNQGHHVYNYKYEVGETLIREREITNKHSQNATAVKNKDQQVIRHVLEALASKLFTLRSIKLQNRLGYLVEVLKYLASISFMDQSLRKCLCVMSYREKDWKIKVFVVIKSSHELKFGGAYIREYYLRNHFCVGVLACLYTGGLHAEFLYEGLIYGIYS